MDRRSATNIRRVMLEAMRSMAKMASRHTRDDLLQLTLLRKRLDLETSGGEESRLTSVDVPIVQSALSAFSLAFSLAETIDLFDGE